MTEIFCCPIHRSTILKKSDTVREGFNITYFHYSCPLCLAQAKKEEREILMTSPFVPTKIETSGLPCDGETAVSRVTLNNFVASECALAFHSRDEEVETLRMENQKVVLHMDEQIGKLQAQLNAGAASQAEKGANSFYHELDGFLRMIGYKTAWKEWWTKATAAQKHSMKTIRANRADELEALEMWLMNNDVDGQAMITEVERRISELQKGNNEMTHHCKIHPTVAWSENFAEILPCPLCLAQAKKEGRDERDEEVEALKKERDKAFHDGELHSEESWSDAEQISYATAFNAGKDAALKNIEMEKLAAVRSALTEACKIVCPHCRRGEEIEWNIKQNFFQHPKESKNIEIQMAPNCGAMYIHAQLAKIEQNFGLKVIQLPELANPLL